MTEANPGIHHVRVGDAVVTVLNDGQFDASLDLVLGLAKADGEALLRGSHRVTPPRITVSCFVIRMSGRTILVDHGTGDAYGPVLGHAREKLGAIGVRAEDVDTILVTHAHPDHVMGLVGPGGGARFPRAELLVHRIEHDFWMSETNAAKAPEAAKEAFRHAQTGLRPYAGRTRLIEDGQEVAPGITAKFLPGHTPGHTGYLITSAGQSLLIWGDVVHLPGIQFARPEAGMAFDSDAEQARATRRQAFEMTAREGVLVAGIHLDFPTLGHVVRHGDGHAWEPLVWAPTDSGLFPAG
jgi:glyoxylase-like metal-dependent hydrolase (beta-lactamase superfamily II)